MLSSRTTCPLSSTSAEMDSSPQERCEAQKHVVLGVSELHTTRGSAMVPRNQLGSLHTFDLDSKFLGGRLPPVHNRRKISALGMPKWRARVAKTFVHRTRIHVCSALSQDVPAGSLRRQHCMIGHLLGRMEHQRFLTCECVCAILKSIATGTERENLHNADQNLN